MKYHKKKKQASLKQQRPQKNNFYDWRFANAYVEELWEVWAQA